MLPLRSRLSTKLPHNRLFQLILAQALFQCGMSVDLTLTGLVGYRLAPTPALATAPFAAITLGAAATSVPASRLVKRWGYRGAFLLGSVIATVGGVASAIAITTRDFALFCLGTAAVGVYQGFANYYRYAAADQAGPETRSRAIATVLAGGVAAAVGGPFLAITAKDALPTAFAGSYVLVSVLAALSGTVLLTWRGLPPASPSTEQSEQQEQVQKPTARVIFRRPTFLLGAGGAAIGYLLMMLLMTAAPIAATQHHHTTQQAAWIVQWHMVGMFAPSLFSGALVRRWGGTVVLSTGASMIVAAALINLTSVSQFHFMSALMLVGVGWNFLYIAGTTFIAESYSRAERARVQALGEITIMSGSAFGALSAGALLAALGWDIINLLVFGPLLVCFSLVAYYVRSSRAHASKGTDAAAWESST